jgi:hypothetical protein
LPVFDFEFFVYSDFQVDCSDGLNLRNGEFENKKCEKENTGCSLQERNEGASGKMCPQRTVPQVELYHNFIVIPHLISP